MRSIVSIGILFFFSIIQLKAQADFRDGYIVKNENDTIFGTIDYKGDAANAKKCIFIKDINSGKQIFNPHEIKSFRFNDGKYFVSKSVQIEDKTEQLFLEYLINGVVDIYYYRDDKGEHYLLDNGTDNLYELRNEEREISKNNTKYIIESKEYIGLLKFTFKDSPSVSKRAENISLNHKSLINIAHDYHNEVCADEACIIYEKKLPKDKITYGILVGLKGSSISLTSEPGDDFYYLRNSQFGFETDPSIGIYFKAHLPYINERLYIQYEGTYSRVNLTTSNLYSEPLNHMNYLNDISLTQSIFNHQVILKYEYPKGKIRPTLQVGGFMKRFFNSYYERKLDVQFTWGDTYTTFQTNDNPFSKYDYGISCGFGLKSLYLNDRELFLDLKYQRGFGLLQYLNTNTILLNIGFQIGK